MDIYTIFQPDQIDSQLKFQFNSLWTPVKRNYVLKQVPEELIEKYGKFNGKEVPNTL